MQVYADLHGASSAKAKQLANLYADALDAQKSDARPRMPSGLKNPIDDRTTSHMRTRAADKGGPSSGGARGGPPAGGRKPGCHQPVWTIVSDKEEMGRRLFEARHRAEDLTSLVELLFWVVVEGSAGATGAGVGVGPPAGTHPVEGSSEGAEGAYEVELDPDLSLPQEGLDDGRREAAISRILGYHKAWQSFISEWGSQWQATLQQASPSIRLGGCLNLFILLPILLPDLSVQSEGGELFLCEVRLEDCQAEPKRLEARAGTGDPLSTLQTSFLSCLQAKPLKYPSPPPLLTPPHHIRAPSEWWIVLGSISWRTRITRPLCSRRLRCTSESWCQLATL